MDGVEMLSQGASYHFMRRAVLAAGLEKFGKQHKRCGIVADERSQAHFIHRCFSEVMVVSPFPSIALASVTSDAGHTKSGVTGIASELDLPIPLTPIGSEYSQSVELERALVAEAAMKSEPGVRREDVIFEDEWLLVFNKPCGIYSEHVGATAKSMLGEAGRDASSTPEQQPFVHLANRLDRDTSGVLVVIKCKEACAKVTKLFTNREVEKTYVARCAGVTPEWRELLIESGHGRSRFGAWRVYAAHDVGRKLPGGSGVKDMKTRFHIVRPLQEEEGARTCVIVVGDAAEQEKQEVSGEAEVSEVLVRAFPLTGRTHQIRLHCCYMGLPLVGDVKYGGPHQWQGYRHDGHCLHAESLSFIHPYTKRTVQIVAPLPEWALKCGITHLDDLTIPS